MLEAGSLIRWSDQQRGWQRAGKIEGDAGGDEATEENEHNCLGGISATGFAISVRGGSWDSAGILGFLAPSFSLGLFFPSSLHPPPPVSRWHKVKAEGHGSSGDSQRSSNAPTLQNSVLLPRRICPHFYSFDFTPPVFAFLRQVD